MAAKDLPRTAHPGEGCQQGRDTHDFQEVISHLYFAYGSNLNAEDLRHRCPEARPVRIARLDGWRLTFRGVADIEPAEDRKVHGALWLLSDRDVRSLDAYEGVPSHYDRRMVVVEGEFGPHEAMTYVMTRAEHHGLPLSWYLDCIEAGYRYWGLPIDELRRALRETRTAPRGGLMAEITDSLARAFDRIADFQAVQSGRSGKELLEAVTRLQESVGIGDEPRAVIAERLDTIAGSSRAPGHVLLGVIVGLMAAELDTESAPR